MPLKPAWEMASIFWWRVCLGRPMEQEAKETGTLMGSVAEAMVGGMVKCRLVNELKLEFLSCCSVKSVYKQH